ncbi:hypothetical protein KP79_PYT03398 [Mizuhopecten yessoensis]|uniref:Uncharacterized protein n=1 Tax=Mizuhopecten yessoensis TaxID=6573 RepID=A0A210PDG4_MIZYE|nr:hypothetical protein KP79_PYT03398 [Mizuhopecten yessoensis]
MISFWHVLLLPLLFGISMQDVVSNTGCPSSADRVTKTIPENLPKGTELFIFTNISGITLSEPESSHFNVIAKGGDRYGINVLKPYDFEKLQSSTSLFRESVPFTCTSKDGQVVQVCYMKICVVRVL